MTGVIKRAQYNATNANWMKVRVTGYRNWFMIDLPVLEDIAEVAYHRAHNKTNRIVDADGMAGNEEVLEDREDRVRRPLSEDIRESQKANLLRIKLKKDGKISGAELASHALEPSFWESARSFMDDRGSYEEE